MTKADLIEGLSNKLGMNKGEAEKAVNIMLDDIVGALKQGERVRVLQGLSHTRVAAHDPGASAR